MEFGWLIASSAAAVFNTTWTISLKYGTKHIYAANYTSTYCVIATVLCGLGIALFRGGVSNATFGLEWRSLCAGFLQTFALLAFTASVKYAPNSGLALAIFSSQAVLSALLAFFIFGAPLSVRSVVAMLVVVAGVFLISHQKSESESAEEVMTSPKKSLAWLYYAILAGVMISLKDILTQWVTHQKSPPKIERVLWNTLLATTLGLVVYARLKTGEFMPREMTAVNGQRTTTTTKTSPATPKEWGMIAWSGVIYLLFLGSVTVSTALAPNVGYAKSLQTVAVLLTTIVSYLLWRSPITPTSGAGIALIMGGVVAIALLK